MGGSPTPEEAAVDQTQENVATLRRAYQRWHDTRGGSVQDWLDLMADDVTMRTVGDGVPGLEFTRGRRGKGEAQGYFAGLAADWEMVHFTADEFIAQGDRVVVLSRVAFRNKRTGKVAESPKADVFRFRDGRVVDFVEFLDTLGAVAATRPG
jgi:ketosteroid isomerase-like protein